ncbi:ABC transporter permease [Parapedobacter koreensis]|uniref:Putative ABC transport system permease protein n=1 Tax=Parapedobacter koreensis TaxID=332977 RepID=A0A1H7R075_9SPHI|nr:ABC transporter permease [Parapedobacter koreensis]SEL53681.1 putative ABC transport system permease protein [Parapedobacter koreensis]
MIKSYIKIAWRNLWKNKVYSAINIAGLAIGLASFLVILLYLNHELNYDRWDAELGKVYKVSERTDEDIMKRTHAPLPDFLKNQLPLIAHATRISPYEDYEVLLAVGDRKIYQPNFVEADSSFFKVFPFQLVQGHAATALDKPNTTVIEESVAKKLFGDSDPIGKTIKVHDAFELEVTGVMKEPDGPSHLHAAVVARTQFIDSSREQWGNTSFMTYVKTHQVVPVAVLEGQVDELYYEQRLKKDNVSFQDFRKAGHQAGLFVDAVQDLHNFPKHADSNFTTVSILLVLAALLLLAGAINFSNLSIAASIRRAKEVGVRKVLGSNRKQLLWQFLGEIALQCAVSLGLASLLVSLALPYFNTAFNVQLAFWEASNASSIALQAALCLVAVIVLSGLYPAVFLSRYNPVYVLKGDLTRGTKGLAFRNALIVVQFVVSAFFVIGTLVISKQMQYMQTRERGFSGEQVLRIEADFKTREAGFETMRSALLRLPGVLEVSKTTAVPGDVYVDTSTWAFKHAGEVHRMSSVKVSAQYFKTLGIDLVQGRLFDDSYADQHTRSAIINEAGARKLNLEDPIGAIIHFPGCDSVSIQVVGVVRDFNVSGFEQSIKPVAYTIGNDACVFQSAGAVLVKLAGDDIGNSVSAIEQAWKNIEPAFPIRYSFLDDNFQQLFASYIRLQRIINFFGFTAIAIAVMGLFALTAFLVGQRMKEISIRKVLGASIADLGLLLSKGFMRLIALAVTIAIPLGWWAANAWLQGFAYRISLNGWVFLIAALAVLAVAALTVGFHTFKAAKANPADTLREE